MSEHAWLTFWVVITVLSNGLFLAVAVLVTVRGWRELADLRKNIGGTPEGKAEGEPPAHG